MSITIIRDGNSLRLLSSADCIPEGTPLTLYTAEELDGLSVRPTAWESAQLDSAFSDGEDWGDTLDALVIPRES